MAGQLGLTAEQTTQVRAAELVRAQARLRQLEAQHATGRIPLGPEDVAIENKFEAQLKAICTPAQYERHQAIQPRFQRIRAQADSLRSREATPGPPK